MPCHPFELTLDQAVPLGLHASELVSNAAKCAFPGVRAGKVVVRLNPEGNDAILSVADDGIGVPATLETAGTGLGLTMVRGLAQQVCGILAMENDGGTRLTLRFKPAAAFVAAMRNSSLGVRRYCPHNRDQEGQA